MRLLLLSAFLATAAACTEAAEPPPGWGTDFTAALRDAKAAGRPVLVDFGAKWCGPCRKLEASTFRDQEVAAFVQSGFVAVKVDVDDHPDVAKKFGVNSFPTMVVLSPDGKELARRSGYIEAAGFLQWLRPHRGKAAAAARGPLPAPAPIATAAVEPRQVAVARPEYEAATRAAEARLAERYLALADRAADPAEAADYRRKAADLTR